MCGLEVTCESVLVMNCVDTFRSHLMTSVMTVQIHRLYLLLQHIKTGFGMHIGLIT